MAEEERENYGKLRPCCIKYVCCLCFELPRHQILYRYDILEELDAAFIELDDQESESFLKKYLTPAVYNTIKYRQTHQGNTLLDVIISGTKNPDSIFGVYAPDSECYRTFAELMYPIICAAHFIPYIISHPRKIRYGATDYITALDGEGHFVKSVRFELSRNVKGHKFQPSMNKAELHDLQNFVSAHFHSFKKLEFRGRYVRYKGLEDHTKTFLNSLGLMFPEQDKWLQDANGRKFWPSGRGIFIPTAMDFAIWVNVEDHLKLVVVEDSGDFKKCYQRLVQLHKKLHRRFDFQFDEHLGYLNVCPSNIGTGLHAEIELELPILQQHPNFIQKICNEYWLAAYGHGGQHSRAKPGETFYIRTTRALGIDEYNSIMPVYEGALELLVTEHRFSKELRRLRQEDNKDLTLYPKHARVQKLANTIKAEINLQKGKHVHMMT